MVYVLVHSRTPSYPGGEGPRVPVTIKPTIYQICIVMRIENMLCITSYIFTDTIIPEITVITYS